METPSSQYSSVRRVVLLVLFCIAQFLDTFNSSALFSAVPAVTSALKLKTNESIWLLSAYQLTFASFLLVSGRVSDVYNPKYVFVAGMAVFGGLSLGSGFLNNKIVFLIFRALIGIAAALTIPSALHLIVHLYPEPKAQATAIAAFGGSVAIGNVSGLVIGAALVDRLSWRWVFWFAAALALPISGICAVMIPQKLETSSGFRKAKPEDLDVVGVVTLTAALVLFIFAVTSGASVGWKSAETLAPLFVSVLVVLSFVKWESRLPFSKAALPNEIWHYKNFTALFFIALLPILWWTTVFFQFSSFWQESLGWSALRSATHLLPLGCFAFPAMIVAGKALPNYTKSILLLGHTLQVVATALLPFADRTSRYWSFNFVAFTIGTIGTAIVFTRTNVAILQTSPPQLAGTVGAIFNAALQIGSAVGVSVIGSVQTSVGARTPPSVPARDPAHFRGRAAGMWFLLGLCVAELVVVLVFFRRDDGRDVGREELRSPTPHGTPESAISISAGAAAAEKLKWGSSAA